MAARSKGDSQRAIADAKTKLSRLLETENELESVLEDAKQEGEALVEAARLSAQERVTKFEIQLEAEDSALQDQIASDRDRLIASIRSETQAEIQHLNQLDDGTLDELARHVVQLLLGSPKSGDRR